jgi:AraC-like DNA-binding protein
MPCSVVNSQFFVKAPAPSLLPYVSQYWLSLRNEDSTYSALPDGAVDIVVKIQDKSISSWVYGTTTRSTTILIDRHCHYLGIRFRPGQSRHFLHASALELTDRYEPTKDLLKFSFHRAFDADINISVFSALDQLLQDHLTRMSPVRTRMDDAVAMIQANSGTISIDLAAKTFCRSRRQFERVFQESVGVSPKLFSRITRFQNAASNAANGSDSLADIATSSGYYDQSHMTHEFKRFANASPKQFMPTNVAFLQGVPEF